MTLDEAHLILNTKKEEGLEHILKVCVLSILSFCPVSAHWIDLVCSNPIQNYEHLFKMNSPASVPPLSGAPTPRPAAGKQPVLPSHSHYLQSKVVRARERIEAELKISEEDAAARDTPAGPASPPPPPPTEGGPGPGSKSS